jgi:tRNA modification GTPase
MNALANRDVAIVTDIAGTTRDVLGVDLDIGGYLVHLMDTAGLRETADIVEREGVRRTFLTMETADLILHLQASDGGDVIAVDHGRAHVLTIQSKSDLLHAAALRNEQWHYLSTLTGEGLDSLTKRIAGFIAAQVPAGVGLGPARLRQAAHLTEAAGDIERSMDAALSLEMKAEHLRRAAHSLGKITGRVDVEDLLDVIFSEFCIGK